MEKDNIYYVYKHTVPNGKVYIGITKQNPNRRWRNGHGYYSSNLFFNAILKYGWINITHEILHEGVTFEEACNLEKYYIQYYNSNNSEYGYNITKGGEIRRCVPKITNKIGTGKNKGKQIIV